MKIDVDICDNIAEEFGITALPSFVIIERIQHDEKNLAQNSILSRLIGKNSPNLVKKEVESWLTQLNGATENIKENDLVENDEADTDATVRRDGGGTETMSDTLRTKPRKKKSFTSLILRDANVEHDARK